jgi:hypothetical protein
MTKEMNYLSEKIERIENEINEGEKVVNETDDLSLKDMYKSLIQEASDEKQLLDNILSFVTLKVLEERD